MNINFDRYLKSINPIATIIFSAYFICTLLLFTLPKRGIDYLYTSDSVFLKNTEKNSLNKTKSLSKNLVLKAVYKMANGKSWLVIDNKKTAKKLFIKEGDNIEGFVFHKINSGTAFFKNGDIEFKLKLLVNTKNIEYITKRSGSENEKI